MEKLKIDIAIIGGGIAAITFAENYKKFNPDATIAIFEKTNFEPYSKVLLPHYIKKIVSVDKIIIRTEKQLEDKGIKYYKNENVTTIDTANKCFDSTNYSISFNKLIIATGGETRELNTSACAYYLQTIEDADMLIQKLGCVGKDKPAVVVGGGFISFELFEIFHKYNLKIINLIKSGIFFPNLAPLQLTPILSNLLKQNSVEEIIAMELIQDITENTITFDNQTINSSLVAIGAGITRTHRFFGKTEEGIKTNEFLESDYKDIYAVGDVAIVTKNNIPRITGNWNNAIQQGIWLAKYLANQVNSEYSFNRATDYTTTFFGNHLSFIGNTDQNVVNNKITLSNEKQFISECYLNDKLVGAILLNNAGLRTLYQDKVNLITG